MTHRTSTDLLAKYLLGIAFWTFIGLSFAFQFHMSAAQAGLNVSWKQAIKHSLADWYVFAVLSIPVIWLARRTPFEHGSRAKSLAAHVAASVVFSLAYIALRARIGAWQTNAEFQDALRPLLVKTWHFNLLIYWVIVGMALAFDYHRKYRERELRAAELEKTLAETRLQALQMQLNPHFLFNSLHSISSLMHRDVEAADRMIARLGELLRAALDTSSAQEIPLRRELDFLQRYLEIEQIRFGARLGFQIKAPPETLDARVPNLILQPLVENAVRHGVEPHARPGMIELLVDRRGEGLSLEVWDNGDGLTTGPVAERIGLSNTKARLQTLYGDAHQFEMVRPGRGGLSVRLLIPFRTELQSA